MSKSSHLIGNKRIQDIMIPGTHNSGSYAITRKSAYAPDQPILQKYNPIWPVSGIVANWARCQSKSIAEQLNDGIRYIGIKKKCLTREVDVMRDSWEWRGVMVKDVEQYCSTWITGTWFDINPIYVLL